MAGHTQRRGRPEAHVDGGGDRDPAGERVCQVGGARAAMMPALLLGRGVTSYDIWDGNPSGTVWRRVTRQSLKDGVRVLLRFKSSRSEELEEAGWLSYSDKWAPAEEQTNMRRVAGTGDFRIGLMQTNGGGMGSYHAYQVRINP